MTLQDEGGEGWQPHRKKIKRRDIEMKASGWEPTLKVQLSTSQAICPYNILYFKTTHVQCCACMPYNPTVQEVFDGNE